jgi:chromosome segregation ATPase
MARVTRKKTSRVQKTSDGEETRHQRPLDQIKEVHERLALLQRAYDALSERLSDQRLAIAESWEERDLARAASDTAARSEALTEFERRTAKLLEEGTSLRAQLAAEAERREEAEKGLRSAAAKSERRVAELLEEGTSLRAQLTAESSRRTAAETEMRRISEEAAALRAELEQLRPDHEQLTKFHWMVLAEVDALLNDKRVLSSRLAEVEAERDAARQNAERVSAALAAQAAAQEAQLAHVRAEYDVLHSEFVRFTHLRLFRYTALLRAVYGQVRRLLGLKRP